MGSFNRLNFTIFVTLLTSTCGFSQAGLAAEAKYRCTRAEWNYELHRCAKGKNASILGKILPEETTRITQATFKPKAFVYHDRMLDWTQPLEAGTQEITLNFEDEPLDFRALRGIKYSSKSKPEDYVWIFSEAITGKDYRTEEEFKKVPQEIRARALKLAHHLYDKLSQIPASDPFALSNLQYEKVEKSAGDYYYRSLRLTNFEADSIRLLTDDLEFGETYYPGRTLFIGQQVTDFIPLKVAEDITPANFRQGQFFLNPSESMMYYQSKDNQGATVVTSFKKHYIYVYDEQKADAENKIFSFQGAIYEDSAVPAADYSIRVDLKNRRVLTTKVERNAANYHRTAANRNIFTKLIREIPDQVFHNQVNFELYSALASIAAQRGDVEKITVRKDAKQDREDGMRAMWQTRSDTEVANGMFLSPSRGAIEFPGELAARIHSGTIEMRRKGHARPFLLTFRPTSDFQYLSQDYWEDGRTTRPHASMLGLKEQIKLQEEVFSSLKPEDLENIDIKAYLDGYFQLPWVYRSQDPKVTSLHQALVLLTADKRFKVRTIYTEPLEWWKGRPEEHPGIFLRGGSGWSWEELPKQATLKAATADGEELDLSFEVTNPAEAKGLAHLAGWLYGQGDVGGIPGLYRQLKAAQSGQPLAGSNAEAAALAVLANNSLALDLLKKQVGKADLNDNPAIPAHSLASVLQLLVQGAEGDTLKEILTTLHADQTGKNDIEVRKTLAEGYRRLNATLRANVEGNPYRSVNGIFTDIPLASQYSKTVFAYLGAKAETLDFGNDEDWKKINQFVSDNTNGKITNLIPRNPGPNSTALVAASRFLGNWQAPFSEDSTWDSEFTLNDGKAKTTPFMKHHEKRFIPYYQDEDAQVVSLPYKNGYSMKLFVPKLKEGENPTQALKRLQSHLTVEKYRKIVRKGLKVQEAGVSVYLPKFELKYTSKDLPQDLSATMPRAFSGAAELSGIGAGMNRVSDVFAQASVRVDEKGTAAEGGAAAIVSRGISRAPAVYAGHAFLYTIQKDEEAAILFAGVIQNPSWPGK